MRRLTLLLGALLLAGCGRADDRCEVSGRVSLRGQPIEDGIIQFAPLDGQATGEGAQIVQGAYLIPRAKGLAPGKYRVSIYAGNGLSGAGNASPDSPHAGVRQPKERVPPEFNEKSQVVKEVTPGQPNTFDFTIP